MENYFGFVMIKRRPSPGAQKMCIKILKNR
jgi:hypothetical protein